MASIILLSDYLNEETINKLKEDERELNDSKEYIAFANQLVFLLKIPVKTGDIMQLEEDVYRNDTKIIWNGVEFISLDTKADDYGAVPPLKQFAVPENFLMNHWYDAIDHNHIVPVDHSLHRDEILATNQIDLNIKHYTDFLKEISPGIYTSDDVGMTFNEGSSVKHQVSKAYFTHDGVKYTIYYDWANPEPLTIEEMNNKLEDKIRNEPVALYYTQNILEEHATTEDKDLDIDTENTFVFKFDCRYQPE